MIPGGFRVHRNTVTVAVVHRNGGCNCLAGSREISGRRHRRERIERDEMAQASEVKNSPTLTTCTPPFSPPPFPPLHLGNVLSHPSRLRYRASGIRLSAHISPCLPLCRTIYACAFASFSSKG